MSYAKPADRVPQSPDCAARWPCQPSYPTVPRRAPCWPALPGKPADAELFDDTIDTYQRLLDQADETDMFTFREIQLRGLVDTGRPGAAAPLMAKPYDSMPAAPQWGVIEQVTTGQVLLSIGDQNGAEQALLTAITSAQIYQLPHQLQRTLRLADSRLNTIMAAGRAALSQLDEQLTNAL
jgi:hypothetical protein